MMQKQDLQALTPDSNNALLKDAIRSHADGDIDTAITLYSQLLQTSDPPKHVFQNLISALRSKKKLTEGLQVSKLALTKYPRDASILLNQEIFP